MFVAWVGSQVLDLWANALPYILPTPLLMQLNLGICISQEGKGWACSLQRNVAASHHVNAGSPGEEGFSQEGPGACSPSPSREMWRTGCLPLTTSPVR